MRIDPWNTQTAQEHLFHSMTRIQCIAIQHRRTLKGVSFLATRIPRSLIRLHIGSRILQSSLIRLNLLIFHFQSVTEIGCDFGQSHCGGGIRQELPRTDRGLFQIVQQQLVAPIGKGIQQSATRDGELIAVGLKGRCLQNIKEFYQTGYAIQEQLARCIGRKTVQDINQDQHNAIGKDVSGFGILQGIEDVIHRTAKNTKPIFQTRRTV